MADAADTLSSPQKRRRTGGRAGNRRREGAVIDQMPWRLPVNIDRPTEPLTEEGVARLHDATMRILEDIGIEFLHPEAIEILEKAGATVSGENVRMGRDMVMEYIAKAPSSFTLTPRNPDRTLTVGDGHILFGNVSSPPNYFDLEIGKKVSGTRSQCANLLKLTQYFNCIHFAGGYPVEPVDVHASVRHLDVVFDKLTLTDKVMHAYSLGKERVEDVMEMVRIAGGLTHEEFDASPRMYTNINSTSPLKHDFPMMDGWMRMARRGQGLVVTPFTLAGAMAPVTMAGAVAQSLAEGLVAVVLAQIINPGVPCVIGTFTSNVDMKTGAPAFGTPEYMRATQMTGQMARFYGLPMRSSGVCAANVPDGQAMWETEHSLWAAIQSGTNMVYHAAGWLEGGLIASPEKFVMDCEVLQQMQRYLEPEICDVSDDALAVDTIREVGPNGHFFGVQHTQDRYETAFYQPFLSDWKNFEAWESAGAVWTAERAHTLFKRIINEFEAPEMDVAIREELEDFVARRKAEGGAPTDF
ncbi:trimethylamine methyltransferase family protein [Mameliella sediminis]|uniref:trimethylamine methyltransferase family protein n=1 Tax=Mameliella sediminis TaxID=2836866 RepID=UPI001C496219|nr:trimethylamine methyltransferase family protein [Mameliella sediminis]MBV7394124.1 trimethylamine methyltransferase family protein [Mameliella sediminis]MBY6162464.1 trimethylamine methyltransferase family protein [Mameliella alba]MBY6170938.1 trimethylamine methyltransferase family protein [Mameliella alba]MBY6175951.1 trimethylamine methyltransferase family protein [Mameliella alba]